jgi:hypothetical protein
MLGQGRALLGLGLGLLLLGNVCSFSLLSKSVGWAGKCRGKVQTTMTWTKNLQILKKQIATIVTIAGLQVSGLPSAYAASQSKPAERPLMYSIESTEPPSLLPRTPKGESSLIHRLSEARVLLLGDHTGKIDTDTVLESKLLRQLAKESKAQKRKLHILTVSDDPLTSVTPPTPANKYISLHPATQTIQTREEMLSALSREFADIVTVERVEVPQVLSEKVLKEGLEGLSDELKGSLVSDPVQFVEFVTLPGFRLYSEQVFQREYEDYISSTSSSTISTNNNGNNENNPIISFENFVSSEMIRHEYLARTVADSAQRDRDALVVALLPASDLRFGYGVNLRTLRNLHLQQQQVDDKNNKETDLHRLMYSAMLNPSPQDSLSFITPLRLSLSADPDLEYSFTKEDIEKKDIYHIYNLYGMSTRHNSNILADFLLYADSPAVRIIPRMKNGISREGEKPPGEDSVLKAF